MPYTLLTFKEEADFQKEVAEIKNGGLNQDGERPRESILLKTLLRREEP